MNVFVLSGETALVDIDVPTHFEHPKNDGKLSAVVTASMRSAVRGL